MSAGITVVQAAVPAAVCIHMGVRTVQARPHACPASLLAYPCTEEALDYISGHFAADERAYKLTRGSGCKTNPRLKATAISLVSSPGWHRVPSSADAIQRAVYCEGPVVAYFQVGIAGVTNAVPTAVPVMMPQKVHSSTRVLPARPACSHASPPRLHCRWTRASHSTRAVRLGCTIPQSTCACRCAYAAIFSWPDSAARMQASTPPQPARQPAGGRPSTTPCS